MGSTNIVPVDYVAKAMDHLAHEPGLDGRAFHLVNPTTAEESRRPQRLRAGGQVAVVPDRRSTTGSPTCCRPAGSSRRWAAARPAGPGEVIANQTLGRLGHPGRGARARLDCPPATTRPRRSRRWRAPSIEIPQAAQLRGDALGLLGAEPRPRHPGRQGVGEGAPGQDGRHHRRVVGHRQGDGPARRSCSAEPRSSWRAARRSSSRRRATSSRRAARRTPTPATCPTSTRSTSWPRS